jgi:cyclic pyranopterin phosphate synthase
MPAEVFGEHYQFLPKPEILSLEEIARLTEVFCKLGLEKIRLTGGEPLLRRGMPELIAMLAAIPGERDIAMTTNGTILPRYAKKLKVAGLHRVTISLDAIDPKVFAHMNGVGASPDRVLEGIDAALEYGLGVKVNSVIQKGVNEDQVLPLAEFARERGVTLRFIEFMDTGNTNGWKLDQVVPYTEMIQSLHQHFPLEPLDPAHVGETARRFSYKDFPDQEIGFITSVSKPFCADCNRIRLSADGHLYTCLFASHGHDIKSLLRAGASDAELIAMIHGVWSVRDDRYSEIRTEICGTHVKPEMSYIGG